MRASRRDWRPLGPARRPHLVARVPDCRIAASGAGRYAPRLAPAHADGACSSRALPDLCRHMCRRNREGQVKMLQGAAAHLDNAQLEQALKAVDPAVFVVPPRVLRRIIKQERKVVGIGLRVPHDRSYVTSRDTVLRLADREALGLEPGQELPARVILIARPDSERLATRRPQEVLVRYWQ